MFLSICDCHCSDQCEPARATRVPLHYVAPVISSYPEPFLIHSTRQVNVRAKAVAGYPMKGEGGSRGVAPIILNLYTNGQFHTPAALPRQITQYALNNWLGGPQRWNGRFSEEKKILHLSGFSGPA